MIDAVHEATVHWQFLGLELGILYPMLETIEQENSGNIKLCLGIMLETWLNGSCIGHMMVVPSWSTLKTALKNIGEDALADTIPTDGELITTCLCLYLYLPRSSCVLLTCTLNLIVCMHHEPIVSDNVITRN